MLVALRTRPALIRYELRVRIEKTILEEECERPGEVRYGGTLLCAPHAALLGLEDRAGALLGSVFRMDEWMEEYGDSAADGEFLARIKRERGEAVAALRLTRAKLRSVRKALSEGRAGVPRGPRPERLHSSDELHTD